jgi:hypothetical protein
MYQEIADIKKEGFVGFKTIRELWQDMSAVPKEKGIYLIINPTMSLPEFLVKGSGGFHKQRDPNIPIASLSEHWVKESRVIYIGKAGGKKSPVTLRKRLGQYLEFGKGKPVGHYGGRLIWQLQHHPELLVAWKVTPTADPREEERKLISKFEAFYNQLPFANLNR